mmetsp:Transcript_8065/g.10110  ORF Transcript_8065/g.10110 Transcript_8065/m.10110 type:complete len:274 (-) Transcript_8065:320-1141(-)
MPAFFFGLGDVTNNKPVQTDESGTSALTQSNAISNDRTISLSRSLRGSQQSSIISSPSSGEDIEKYYTTRREIEESSMAANPIMHRSLEDVDYWRHRAGWYDDAVDIIDDIYSAGDDYAELEQNPGGLENFLGGDITADIIGITVAFLCLAVLVIVVRTIRRKSRESGSGEKSRSSNRSRSASSKRGRASSNKSLSSDKRSRSRARSVGRESRSRSKSRGLERERSSRSKSRGRRETSENDYSLMEEGGSSKKSSRPRSKSRSSSRRKGEVLV